MRSRVSFRHVELGHVDRFGDCMLPSQSIRSLDDLVSLPYVSIFSSECLQQLSQIYQLGLTQIPCVHLPVPRQQSLVDTCLPDIF